MNDKQFSYKDVKILEQHTLYKGHFRLDEYRVRFRKFAGDWSRPTRREVFERGNAAAILLYDPQAEQIILVEQFRIGAMSEMTEKKSPWLLETVAGVIEGNETPLEVVIREAKEEAGYTLTPKDITPICQYFASPGASTEKIFLFYGLVSVKMENKIYGVAEEMEDICSHQLSLEEVKRGLEQGKFTNAITLIALQWLLINHKNLK